MILKLKAKIQELVPTEYLTVFDGVGLAFSVELEELGKQDKKDINLKLA